MSEIALIILNYNSADDTIACVRQLSSLRGGWHLVVVDNRSTDGSLERIRSELDGTPLLDILEVESNGGYSAGNNAGIRFARDRYGVDTVGILNPDVIIPGADVIEKMDRCLWSRDEYAVCGASALNARHEYNPNFSSWDLPTAWQAARDHAIWNGRRTRTRTLPVEGDNCAVVDCVAGCFFIAKTAVLEEVGLLDERVFLYNEENILGWKLKGLGYKEIVVLDRFYVHNHRAKPAEVGTLSHRLKIQKIGYRSRRYFIEMAYGKLPLMPLAVAEGFNRLLICASSAKHSLSRALGEEGGRS